VAVCVAHHLSEAIYVELIRNVRPAIAAASSFWTWYGTSSMTLFCWRCAPDSSGDARRTDRRSIRRAYTPLEMRAVVNRALEGTCARFRHSVAPLYMRQIVDITYNPLTREATHVAGLDAPAWQRARYSAP